MSSLEHLNKADNDQAFQLLEPLIERAPHVAVRVAEKRPFKNVEEIALAIAEELHSLDDASQIALFNSHPELAPDKPLEMTHESQSEQNRLHLTSDFNAEIARLKKLNLEYKEKFGFPFITALVRHDNLASVLDEFKVRLSGNKKSEISNAIEQVVIVSKARVLKNFDIATKSGVSNETR
ncbi:MAG: 2-oxo-4-hydroxy-4-carboxy-5-ureidoimidazoline decarboxylase [Hyphomicrobiales bacterium]